MNTAGTMKNPPTIPNSIKIRFAIKFLQAINKLNTRSRFPQSGAANKYRRYRIIRAAACASMASAVGPRKAWSRAVLRKIRNRTRHRFLASRNRCRKSKGSIRGNPRPSTEDDLRGLVPGGEAMDSCGLLRETAHYIKCLRTQVQVMTKMLDHYSTSKN